MKTKHLKTGLVFMAASVTLSLFNGFVLNSWDYRVSFMETVNEASRISHAKELLGSSYKGSFAQKIEGQADLNELILEKVQKQLPQKFKNEARSITSTVIKESARYGLDPIFVLAIIKTESSFNPLAVGPFAEIGLMQVKPDTGKWIANKFNIPWKGDDTLRNPSANIQIGLAYINYLRGTFDKKATRYVSAYNMGPKNVRRLVAKNIKPVEYKSRVMKNYGVLYSRLVIVPKVEKANQVAASF